MGNSERNQQRFVHFTKTVPPGSPSPDGARTFLSALLPGAADGRKGGQESPRSFVRG